MKKMKIYRSKENYNFQSCEETESNRRFEFSGAIDENY